MLLWKYSKPWNNFIFLVEKVGMQSVEIECHGDSRLLQEMALGFPPQGLLLGLGTLGSNECMVWHPGHSADSWWCHRKADWKKHGIKVPMVTQEAFGPDPFWQRQGKPRLSCDIKRKTEVGSPRGLIFSRNVIQTCLPTGREEGVLGAWHNRPECSSCFLGKEPHWKLTVHTILQVCHMCCPCSVYARHTCHLMTLILL